LISVVGKRSHKYGQSAEESPARSSIPLAPLTKSAREVIQENRRRKLLTAAFVAVMCMVFIGVSVAIAGALNL
jgi:hypothetical protein